MKRITAFAFLAAIILTGFLLRHHNYAVWPRQGATFDEYAWTWLGMSILTDGIPRSWSYHPQYKDREQVNIDGADFILVRPYLEHPPVFGLVAGGYALANGIRDFESVRLGVIRELSLFLGLISIVLVFWLAALLYGARTGLLAAGMYAVTPTVAVGSRLVQNENFFIPLWLSMLIMLWYFFRDRKPALRIWIGILGGVLILSKIPWIAATLSVMGILFYRKRSKDAWIIGGIAAAVGLMYPLYGVLTDRDVFTGLMGLQLNRYDITFNGVYNTWLTPLLADRWYLDGWIYWGWIALFLLAGSFKKHWFLVIALSVYAVIYLAGIPDEPGHGWYRYPFYPILTMASAVVLASSDTSLPFRSLFLFAVGLPLLANTWGDAFGFSFVLYRIYIAWSLIPVLPLFFPGKHTGTAGRFSYYAGTVFLFVLSVWSILRYNEQ